MIKLLKTNKTPADKVKDGDIQFYLADMIALPIQYSNRTKYCE